MTESPDFDASAAVAHFQERLSAVKNQMARVLVGQEMIVEGVLMGLMSGGHILLEGVPGLGKTLMVRALGSSLGLDFSRIQFTPDLMPADVTGTNILAETPEGRRRFEFQRGPVFTHILLADEINRATPKTQSALLEAMQETSVTVAGTTYTLEEPYIVLATQNPVEQEGTYPLPEAQLDRFLFKLKVYFPSADELLEILNRTTTSYEDNPQPVLSAAEILKLRQLVREVPVAPHVQEHAVHLVLGTHPDSEYATENVKRFVRYGASPRGAQALILAAKVRALLEGRFHASFEDIDFVARPALRHRIILSFEGQAEGADTDELIEELLERHAPVAV
ncbi:MAG: MoxR family ATPase [Armatimonadetes bacterium]|nr:MoxR family ATPase [Armatimonadota bacterium]